MSPQPPRKKIRLNIYPKRIFNDGDIIAVQLQTAGKQYTMQEIKPVSERDFQAFDGKYVLMQLVECFSSQISSIVPEVKDYWACFRLFDGVYDTVPENIDVQSLKDALMLLDSRLSSGFSCESSMVYFKRRNCKVICNREDLLHNLTIKYTNDIWWSVDKPWQNPDSEIIAAMGNEIVCKEFTGTDERTAHICRYANRCFRRDYSISEEENEARFAAEEKIIAEKIKKTISDGGKMCCISIAREIGIVTVNKNCIDNLYIEGRYQCNGLGTRLLEYALSVAGDKAYIDVPVSNKDLMRICNRLGLVKKEENGLTVRMIKA